MGKKRLVGKRKQSAPKKSAPKKVIQKKRSTPREKLFVEKKKVILTPSLAKKMITLELSVKKPGPGDYYKPFFDWWERESSIKPSPIRSQKIIEAVEDSTRLYCAENGWRLIVQGAHPPGLLISS